MKNIVLALSMVLISGQVFAAATLRIPVIVNIEDDLIPAININQKLAAIGAPRIPLFLEISDDEVGHKKIAAFQVMLEKSLKPLLSNGEYMALAGGFVPTSVDVPGYFTCYKGNAEEIPAIVDGLAGSLYSEQMNLWGYKFKQSSALFNETEETADFLNDESALWRNWNGQNDDLLILSAVGDGGDDVQESLIPKCQ